MALSHLPFFSADKYRSLFEQDSVIKMIESLRARCVIASQVFLFNQSSLGAYEDHLCDRMFVNDAS